MAVMMAASRRRQPAQPACLRQIQTELRMKIEKDRVVRFHYTVSEVGQEPIESSKDRGEPLAILIGHGNIIPGLENAMMDKEAGATFSVDVKRPMPTASAARACPSACRRSTSATPSWPRASRWCCRPTSARVR